MIQFIRNILNLFKSKPKLNISYYKIKVLFPNKGRAAHAFSDVAHITAMPQDQAFLFSITEKYLEGLYVTTPSGNQKFNKEGMTIITNALRHIKDIEVLIIPGIKLNDYNL